MTPASRWLVGDRRPEAETRLRNELQIGPLLAMALVVRGYDEPASADAFLNPKLDDLGAPERLPDYSKAVDILLAAKEAEDLIFVHGDYDVDGITSASLFHRFLLKAGFKVYTHVPHRMKEGYGIHGMAVEAAKEMGAKVFLTCDCGSSALAQIEMAREFGMEVVVTDHTTIGEVLPAAHAFINPHRKDSDYPFSTLSGVGVVFRLCEGLSRELGISVDRYRDAFLDLAVLGTIADVMPLVGENRIIAKFGLERIPLSKKAGIKALLANANLQAPITARHVGFQIGPRLNAAGRIDDAALSLSLLLEEDESKALSIAAEIEQLNTDRRTQQNVAVEEAIALVEEGGYAKDPILLIGKEDWHPGIVGLVAGRLREHFYRPAFAFTKDPESDRYRASARSIPNFPLADAIRALPDLMTGGGHQKAAGCSFLASDLEEVRAALIAYAQGVLTEDDLIPAVEADAWVNWSELRKDDVAELERMAPFGEANPSLRFALKGIEVTKLETFGQTKDHVTVHAKVPDRKWDQKLKAFNQAKRFETFEDGDRIDAILSLEMKEYNGNQYAEHRLDDFRFA